MSWDAAQYEHFQSPRERPFLDLMAQVPQLDCQFILDAGCGTGRTTVALARRWPAAQVLGVDASPEMLDAATEAADAGARGNIRFQHADLLNWQPDQPVDLLVSNAVLHWLPNPENVVRRLAAWVAPNGVLAIQVPANHDQPSHQVIDQVAATGPWADALSHRQPGDHVLSVQEYARILRGLGFEVNAWQTTYLHQLPGDDAVLQWLMGTTLRPLLARLADPAPFLQALAARLRAAYPQHGTATPFPFTRRFVVAQGATPPA